MPVFLQPGERPMCAEYRRRISGFIEIVVISSLLPTKAKGESDGVV